MANPTTASLNEYNAEYIRRLLDVLQDNLTRSSKIHMEFLRNQKQALQTIATSIQIPNLPSLPELPSLPSLPALPSLPDLQTNLKKTLKTIINKKQLQEFGTGLIAKCFGPDFAVLDKRKTPRIPNGDLLMMDRVTEITGEQGNLNPPAAITTEFDVTTDAWFVQENPYPAIPLAVLMEIALQPCGILSAWLGTSLSLPAEVNIFRNLDGQMKFNGAPNLIGATIQNKARLLNSVSSGGMLIQKYAFELSVNGQIFSSGESSFGYFRKEAMENQAGLDQSRPIDFSSNENNADIQSISAETSHLQHLSLVDKLVYTPNAGQYKQGLIQGEKTLTPDEWFYANHFYQDPVMPGSLGVEAIVQGIWSSLRVLAEKVRFKKSVIDYSNEQPLIWKYRGQVLPANKNVRFEIHLQNSPADVSNPHYQADADFWIDDRKIYTIKNISMTLREGLTS